MPRGIYPRKKHHPRGPYHKRRKAIAAAALELEDGRKFTSQNMTLAKELTVIVDAQEVAHIRGSVDINLPLAKALPLIRLLLKLDGE
jgi:hypothetical protein